MFFPTYISDDVNKQKERLIEEEGDIIKVAKDNSNEE